MEEVPGRGQQGPVVENRLPEISPDPICPGSGLFLSSSVVPSGNGGIQNQRKGRTMKRKQMVLVTLAAVAAALVGGMLGGWLFAPTPVQAQSGPSYADEIRVHRLILLDESDNVVGGLFSEPGMVGLWLGDPEAEYLEIGVQQGDSSAIRVSDSRGNIRTSVGVFHDQPALAFFSASSELLWGAP